MTNLYDPAIPLATDLISNSQADIKDNFTSLNTQFGVDHSPFNTGGVDGDGFHKQVTFEANIAPGLAGVGRLYAAGGELTYIDSGSVITQITGVAPNAASGGTAPLMGGMALKWGNQSVSTGAGTAVSFFSATGANFAANCYSVVITILDVNPSAAKVQVKAGSVSNTGFTVITQSASTAIFWMAVGN